MFGYTGVNYINMNTGELTFSHNEAVEWLRAGFPVHLEKFNIYGQLANSLEWIPMKGEHSK